MGKKESTLTNIVSKISKDKQEEIAKEVCDQYDTDVRSRQEWAVKREKWYKLWLCHREVKTSPWVGCSNICIPMLSTASNQFHARAYQSIFAAPGMVRCLPVGKNDHKRAKNVEQYMNWQTLYEMEEYEEVFDRLIQLVPINGIGFKKLYYSKSKDRAVSEFISALDLVLPYRTKSMETARRITHRTWLHYDEILDRKDEKLWENCDDIREVPADLDDESMRQAGDEASGEEPDTTSENPHLILEQHKKFDLGDGKRQPLIFTVDYDSQTLVRASSRDFNGKVLNYFIDYHFLPNPEGFYSFGFGHFLEHLNEMANTAFNQIFDGGSISNTPFGFYGRRAGIKKKQIQLKPGYMTEVDDAKNIYFPSLQRIDQTLFQILGLIQQYGEQFTSTSDYLMGRESKGTKTPTAHGTLAIIEQGLVTFAVITKRIFRSLRKELRLLMALNNIHLPDSKEYRIMGSEDEIPFADIKKDDFDSVYDVVPIGDPSYASKGTRRQEASEVYDRMMGNPLIVGNPEAGMKPNVGAMHEITRDLLETYDKKNINKILPELPEEPKMAEEENAMFMQGDYEEPKPGENHKEHFPIHIRFKQTAAYGSMAAEYKKLVDKHLVATQKQAYMDEQMMQQLGAQSPQGAPQGMPQPGMGG